MANKQKKLIEIVDQNNLIVVQSRGNTVMGGDLESLENARKLPRHPACEVRVSFAAKPDEAAIADVQRMLMSTGSRR